MPRSRTHSDDNNIYSVDMMFVWIHSNKPKAKILQVDRLIHMLESKRWGDPRIVGDSGRYSPIDVLREPEKYPEDYVRIQNADLKYPIIIDTNGDIVDGIHRLTKTYLLKRKTISAYVFGKTLMKKFKIGNSDEWDKVHDMEVSELIELYVKRFVR